jgi:hypothetical protein
MTRIEYPVNAPYKGFLGEECREVGERHMIVLTHDDLHREYREKYIDGKLTIEQVNIHHFNYEAWQTYGRASYVVFMSADNRLKILKHREKIVAD